ncbi:MAG: DUF3014 domain-containing protein [Gammaproteobacteria bacterium]|nr:DUF3014 domain-containing protein [Gammaproteobacteria bacterium]MDD9957492.1 DUF3014 domain-containing protein [Gammaproteobacteria bacterium]
MSKSGLFVIAAVAILTLLSLVYFAITFEAPEGTTTVVIEPPAPALQAVEPAESPTRSAQQNSPLPQIRIQPQAEPPAVAVTDVEEVEVARPPEEIEVVEEEPAVVQEESATDVIQLPTLNSSDSFVLDGLRAMQNGAALVELLARDQIVRKFVVFVENISRGEFPQTGLPYRALGQDMPVRNIDENLFVMDESAHARFDHAVQTFVSMDTEVAMAFYRTLSPLFQQAYAEIGFRNVSFDDTLRAAINNVLRTTNMEGPYQLVRPSIMYLYADASIENLQEVHKQLIRIGPDNTILLKAKLREFVALL